MKRTFHFLLLLFCISTSASAQNYYDVSEFRDQLPELKQTDLVNFSKKDTNAFVTSCSLDTVSRILYYYHCYGGLFSYQPMSKPDMNAILAKKITPFEYFDLVTTFNVNLIEKAKKNLEDNGSNAKFTSFEKQYLDIADSVKFPSTLTKLLELGKQMVSLEVEDTRFHSVNPKYIKRDRSYYKTFNDLQGQMVIWRLSDSIATFYSKSDEPPVYKAVLDLKKAVICFYNRSDSLVDKIEINKSKVALLACKESDVFALYRMWLEWERQSITQAIEETKKSGRVAEKKQYALNVLSEQVKMLSAIDYKIEYFTNADKQFVLQKLRRQFGAIFAPNDPWETGRLVYHTRGDKRYELTDHRGNVMAVISDMKRGVPRKDNPALVDHYEAIVLGATDYTPFGSPMQGRSFNSDKYPYGYNGKEDDNETGYQNYGMRIYDPRVARFLSVDPLTNNFAYYSPYNFAGNNPIRNTDLDGGEPKDYTRNYIHRDLFDLNSLKKVNGSDGTIDLYDSKLGHIDARGVYDNWTKTTWIIGEKDGKYFYFKSDNGNPSEITIHPVKGTDKNTVKGGHFEEYAPQEILQMRYASGSVDKLATAVFGAFAVGAALPALTAIGGSSLLATNSIASSKFWIGASSDLAVQLARGEKINWISVGASGIFANPFAGAFTGSLFKRNENGRYELNNTRDILLTTAIGGLTGSAAGQLGKSINISNSTPISQAVTNGIGKAIYQFGAGATTNLSRDAITKPSN